MSQTPLKFTVKYTCRTEVTNEVWAPPDLQLIIFIGPRKQNAAMADVRDRVANLWLYLTVTGVSEKERLDA